MATEKMATEKAEKKKEADLSKGETPGRIYLILACGIVMSLGIVLLIAHDSGVY